MKLSARIIYSTEQQVIFVYNVLLLPSFVRFFHVIRHN